jgi:hypothetical protein
MGWTGALSEVRVEPANGTRRAVAHTFEGLRNFGCPIHAVPSHEWDIRAHANRLA